MTDSAIFFGNVVTAGMVHDAVKDTIEFWDKTYLAQMARIDGQSGVPNNDPALSETFGEFNSFPSSLDTSKWPEEQLPSCVLVVPGTEGVPVKRGSGKLRARWVVGLGVCVAGPNKERTIQLAGYYTAAVRAILLQHPTLCVPGGTPFSAGTQWISEAYTGTILREQTRSLAMGMLRFYVSVDDVVDTSQGPVTAIEDGTVPTGWPTVLHPSITLNAQSTNEEIEP